jgi:broad specificity phosphatase PhoE
MSSRTWYLVRHGETVWNTEARMQGHLDSPLTSRGRAQALRTARLLARLGVDSMFASPLGRVRETLAILAADVPVAVAFDDRLKEWHGGIWSGERYPELRDKWPNEFAAWDDDRYRVRAPGGENFEDLEQRARAFIEDLPPDAGPRIAIVAHGFFNRAMASVLLSLESSEMLRIRQSNDTIIRVICRPQGTTVDHFVDGRGPVAGLPFAMHPTQVTA